MTDETWVDFERLAARIYEALTPQGAVVTHDDHILGLESGIERQIDVSIRFEVAGHRFLTTVQARDLSSPADVNVVGEFASVVKDVGANKGALICRSGFTSSAQEYARKKGIDLCNIHDAESQKWVLDIRVPILWIDLSPTVKFAGAVELDAGDSVPGSFEEWVISPNRVDKRILPLQTFTRMWNEDLLARDVGPTHRLHSRPGEGLWLLVLDSEGQRAWRPIEVTLEYVVERRTWLGSFSPTECIALFNYSEGRLTARFPVGQVPSQRDDEWIEVDDPDEIVTSVEGSVLTTEGIQLLEGRGEISDFFLRHVETGEEFRPEPSE